MTHPFHHTIRRVALAAILLMTASALPAYADDHHDHDRDRGEEAWQDHEWNQHEMRARNWHRHRHIEPGVVYAPPAVIYAPPPQPYGLNLIIPLNIR